MSLCSEAIRAWCLAALTGLLFLIVQPLAAQTVGTCPRSTGEAYLDVNNVRARILNTGGLFYRGEPHVYEVPKDSGTSAIFASGLWVGGRVNGELRAAATRYGEWEFWAGPLNQEGNPPVDCAPYDRLWKIARADLARAEATGDLTPDIRDWPWHLGAPVLNGDDDPGNYDFEAGDRPGLIGDQMVWWIMNDRGNEHESTDTPPIGLEVRAWAAAFQHPASLINNVTFYHYELHYQGAVPLEDAYVGFYADVDMGYAWDDYIASDSLLHLGYTYGSDENDEGNEGYGSPPPAIGFTILEGPLANPDGRDNDYDGAVDEPGERLGMEYFSCYFKGGWTYGEPITGEEYYNCLQGLWRNGEPIVYGGEGIAGEPGATNRPARFGFPGDPTTGAYWTMENPEGEGVPRAPFDTRYLLSSGPFTMQPGGTETFTMAIVWSRGADRLDSVRKLKGDVAKVRRIAPAILEPYHVLPEQPSPPENYVLGFAPVYPNPFAGTTTLRYSLPQPMRVRLAVYDLLGREVAVLADAEQAAGIHHADFDASNLPAGVYMARLRLDHLMFTKQLLVVR